MPNSLCFPLSSGIASFMYLEKQAKYIYKEHLQPPDTRATSNTTHTDTKLLYYQTFKQPIGFYWLVCTSALMMVMVFVLATVTLQKLLSLRTVSDSNQTEVTKNEKELRKMCNTVLLSRVNQFYHPYYSMSAVSSPNSTSCPDTTRHSEELKTLKKKECVNQFQCFRNAKYHDVDLNIVHKPPRSKSSVIDGNRIDTRFPKVTSVSIQTGLSSIECARGKTQFATIGCSNWPVTKAVLPCSIPSSVGVSASASCEMGQQVWNGNVV